MLHGAGAAPVLLAHLLGSRWGLAAPYNAPLLPACRLPRASATRAAIPQNYSHPTEPNRAAAPAAAPQGWAPPRQAAQPEAMLLPLQGPAADSRSSEKLQLHNRSTEAG